MLPVDYEDLDLDGGNPVDEFLFFDSMMTWAEYNCPLEIHALMLWLFLDYIKAGSEYVQAMEDAYIQSAACDYLSEEAQEEADD